MLQLLFAALLATTAPGPTPPQTESKIAITGDPVKDAPFICMRWVAEKVENALEGRPAVSPELIVYSIAFELTEEQKEKLARDCSLFETGFALGVNAERQGVLTKPVEVPESKGLTTGF